ncbi:MAG: glycosyltransferase family 9 protein [Elusimicrobiota bacterium]
MRILAVRTDARLGNLLLLTPALRLLRGAFPDARISLLCSRRYADVLRFNPCVDEVLGPAWAPSLRWRGYDLAIDFSPHHAFSRSGAFWTWWSGAPKRVGFDRGPAASFCNSLVPVPGSPGHETANLALLTPGGPPKERRPEYHFGPGEEAQPGLDAKTVAFFLGARAEKRLPAAWFLELAARLRSSGRKVALFTGPAEQGLLGDAAIPDGVSVFSGLPVRGVAAMLSHARAVLTPDSGPMHLAAAVGVPTLALFSHTEPWRFGYAHLPGHAVLHTPGRHASVDEAWEALNKLLDVPRQG